MDEQSDPALPAPQQLPSADDLGAEEPTCRERSRRQFLVKSARRIGYVAPVVLLFHPKPACASNGSTPTYWDGAAIKKKPHTPGANP